MVKIAAIGDNVVDCYIAQRQMFPGGNCLNVSVFVHRFGGAAAYVGSIGGDGAGDLIRRALTEEGVDITHLRVLDGPTAYCVIGHRDADRVFLAFDLGVSMFAPTQEQIAFLNGFDAVHVGQSSGLDGHIQAIARQAPLSYDFSVRRDAAHRRTIGPLCFLASISGGDLSKQAAADITEELLQAGAKWVLVTRGKAGAMLSGPLGKFQVASFPVEAVDTLGAGDTFIARTLYGLIAGEKPERLLDEAARAAARTCLHLGAVGYGAPIDIAADLDRLASMST